MANRYQNRTNTQIPRAIGVTTIVFGAAYVILAMILLSNVDLSIDYARPILDKLGDLSREELVMMAIAGDISLAVAGLFGMIFGYGMLRMKKWAWPANVIYNVIFILLCADAFAQDMPLPDSYLVVVSIGLLVMLLMPSTRAYFRQAQIIQK